MWLLDPKLTDVATLMFKRMATSELSDNFCEGEDGDGDDSSSHVSVEAIRRPGQDEARTQGTDSMIAESGSR